MKKQTFFTFKLLILLIAVILVFAKLSLVFAVAGKTGEQDPDRLTTLFYYLPEDSVDILFLGDSHIYCTYINQMINEQTDYVSASLATSSCSVINSYWQLQEALKKQNNLKMVVMETHPFEMSGNDGLKNVLLYYTSGISMIPDLSVNKLLNLKAIQENKYGSNEDITVFNTYSLFEFKEDFDRDWSMFVSDVKALLIHPSSLYKTYGYYPTYQVTQIDRIVTYENNSEYIDFSTTLEYEYLLKIYDLCRENNIQFILSRSIFNDDSDFHMINEQIDGWARENSVNLINYFELVEECDFDFNKDFRDEDHFNYYGAEKATNYFIDSILAND